MKKFQGVPRQLHSKWEICGPMSVHWLWSHVNKRSMSALITFISKMLTDDSNTPNFVSIVTNNKCKFEVLSLKAFATKNMS